MEEILVLHKEVGETPLACLERFRVLNPAYEGVSMTYAGRLDPMAEGLLLVLAGSKVHEKDAYLGLSKKYEAQIVFGVGTDTYDILGIPSLGSQKQIAKEDVEKVLLQFFGKQMQKYPPYSSKPVDGKPLFVHARAGDIDKEHLPEHQIEITNIKLTKTELIQKEDLQKEILSRIAKVVGDFRQEGIVGNWNELFVSAPEKFLAISFTISCSSGTYIRSIAEELGVALGTSATLLTLKRTKLGQFEL